MAQLVVGGRAKHSYFYIAMLRGNARERAEKADYTVIFVNEVSAKVIPFGSNQKYGTQFPIRYLQPVEEELKIEYMCRFCRKDVDPNDPGAEPDIDPVTGEQIGLYHGGCQPDLKRTNSSTPTVEETPV